jgi:long-chain fatty acid transport protein
VKTLNLTKGVLLTLFASHVNAGALYIYETGSPSEIGFAGAGMAGRAQDAGTVFTNPAGMTRFDDTAMLASAGLLYLHAPFGTDSNNTISGKDGDTDEFFPYGSFAYIHSYSDDLKLGISVQNNFGLALDWGTSWVGRYTATSATIIAPQVQPTVAYKVNDKLSIGVGAGLTLGKLDAKLRVNNSNLVPGFEDGRLEYSDTDFAVQANIGIMFEPSSDTRIGLRYLSEASLDFADNPDFNGLTPLVEAITNQINTLDLGLKMPQSAMIGVFHKMDEKLSLLGSVGWDQWSHFGYVTASVNTSPDVTSNLQFKDTWHVGIGAQYKQTPKYTLNAGFSYDTALSADRHRSLAIPLGDMYRFGVGGEYKKRDDLTIGAAVDIMWEGDLPLNNASGGGTVSGQYENVFILFTSVYAKWQ